MPIDINIIKYDALPCHHSTFTINSIDADKKEFGYMQDMNLDNKPDYGCGDYQFIPYDFSDENLQQKLKDIKNKYSIDECDIFEIQSRLQDIFHVGCCSWCS